MHGARRQEPRTRGRRRHRRVGRASGARSRTRSRDAARTSRCSPAARDGLDGAAARGRGSSAAGRSCCRPTSPTQAQVEAAAATVEEQFGPIDVWVNDAMATIFAPLHSTIEPEEFERATEVTYLGTVYGTMAALTRMAPRDRGTIVQVGSALAYRAIPLQSAYCGAKFAIRGFTDSVRTELLHDRSRVWITMVQLPAVNTPQFNWCRTKLPDHPQPVPPIYQPEVPAEAVYWAAHHRRRELWVGRQRGQGDPRQQARARLADRTSRRTGYESQQIAGMPVPPDRPDNLFEPVAGRGRDARQLRRPGARIAQPAAVALDAPRRLIAGVAAAATLAAAALRRAR